MTEWWFSQGVNQLKGAFGYPDNNPVLPDDLIVLFLQKYPEAKESFERLFPTMLPEEQNRLSELREAGNYQPPLEGIEATDYYMNKTNTAGIYHTGLYGGPVKRK